MPCPEATANRWHNSCWEEGPTDPSASSLWFPPRRQTGRRRRSRSSFPNCQTWFGVWVSGTSGVPYDVWHRVCDVVGLGSLCPPAARTHALQSRPGPARTRPNRGNGHFRGGGPGRRRCVPGSTANPTSATTSSGSARPPGRGPGRPSPRPSGFRTSSSKQRLEEAQIRIRDLTEDNHRLRRQLAQGLGEQRTQRTAPTTRRGSATIGPC